MAEEIVRIIKVDTKNSGKSIKDLRNEIKSLRTELEKTEVGTEEFESTLKQLTQTQKSYNEVQQQIRDLSRTNQQDMVKFATFAKNLGKSYSALNAAIGLFADKNEDVQKAMLKVQRTIQLIQGLDGITGLIRDIPKVIAGFKSWLNALNPIERQISKIAKGINGINPNTLKQINEANRAGQGGSLSASSSASISGLGGNQNPYPAQNEAMAKQANTYYPALLQQEKNLYKAREATAQKIKETTASLDAIKKQTLDITQAILSASGKSAPELTAILKEAKESGREMKDVLRELAKGADLQKFEETLRKMGYDTKEIVENGQNVASIYADQTIELEKLKNEYAELDTQYKQIQRDITIQEAGMTKFQKTIAKTGVLAKALGTILKTALYSIGVGIAIGLLVKAWEWITKLIEKGKELQKLNKEISESTNQMAAKGIVAMKELSIAYKKVGDSAKEKEQFLEDYKDKINETGLAIDTVAEAEEAFVKNTPKYIKAITDRAKAQAMEAAAVKIYQDYLDKMYDLEVKLDKKRGVGRQRIRKQMIEETEKVNKRMNDLIGQAVALNAQVDKVVKTFSGTKKEKLEPEVDSTDWAKEYKEILETLRNYYRDRRDIIIDERSKELVTENEFYEQRKQDLQTAYDEGIKAAQGNEQKINEVKEAYRLADKANEIAHQQTIAEIMEKYEKQRLDEVEEYYRKQIETVDSMIRMANSKWDRIQNQPDLDQPTTHTHPTWLDPTIEYENWDDVKRNYEEQLTYNQRLYEVTVGRLQEEIELLKQKLELEGLSDEERLATLAEIAKKEGEIRDAAREKQQSDKEAEQERLQKIKDSINGTIEAVGSLTGAWANYYKAQSQNERLSEKERASAYEKYKKFAIAQAIADTWSSAVASYNAMASIPTIGPALGIAAAAAAVAMGMANVQNIKNETSSISSGSSVSAPAPLETAPIEYTRNLVGDKELDEINQPIRCYVLESDISKTQNKVKVTEMNATF